MNKNTNEEKSSEVFETKRQEALFFYIIPSYQNVSIVTF